MTEKENDQNKVKKNGFFARVYDVLSLVPKGRVVTYGQIAAMAGAPRMARQVGYALHANPKPVVIPCHRVVNRFGRLSPAFAFGGAGVQAELLSAEGVEITEKDGEFFVDLSVYGLFEQEKTKAGFSVDSKDGRQALKK